jgi:hypothetical protein
VPWRVADEAPVGRTSSFLGTASGHRAAFSQLAQRSLIGVTRQSATFDALLRVIRFDA